MWLKFSQVAQATPPVGHAALCEGGQLWAVTDRRVTLTIVSVPCRH